VKIIRRPIDPILFEKAKQSGVSERLAEMIASRGVPHDHAIDTWLAPSLKHLSSPHSMQDIEKAATRVAHAVINQEIIGLETDHDCDGQTSHAVLYEALTAYFHLPSHCVKSYIGHRLEEGYGLSAKLAARILDDDPAPTLLITADNGSSDEARIALLKENGMDVIVTDHHAIPMEGIPQSAFAVLNPTRSDCDYPDPYIAGCYVAWLLMAATRKTLIDLGYLKADAPHLAGLLDFVAVGTVADCVSLSKSINNRAIIRYGLKEIAKMKRSVWRSLQPLLKNPPTAEDLGFLVGPLLNSDGRLSSAMRSVSFLLSETDMEAEAWVTLLQKQNKNRKAIQKSIVEKGLVEARKQNEAGQAGLVIYLPDGHAGVHGIAASKIKDHFGAPCVFLAPKFESEGVLTGSVRGIDGFHVRQALQWVHDQNPTILLSFGGHQGAGGLSLRLDCLSEFTVLLDAAVRQQMRPDQLGPVLLTDGPLASEELSLDFVDTLAALEPFGRECEAPIFEIQAEIKAIKWMGEDEVHARVDLQMAGKRFSAVWFFARANKETELPINVRDQAQVIVSLKAETYRGERQFKPQIHYLKKI